MNADRNDSEREARVQDVEIKAPPVTESLLRDGRKSLDLDHARLDWHMRRRGGMWLREGEVAAKALERRSEKCAPRVTDGRSQHRDYQRNRGCYVNTLAEKRSASHRPRHFKSFANEPYIL